MQGAPCCPAWQSHSQHPQVRLPAVQRWRGAAVPVLRAAGPELLEHTSWPALGFLILKVSWPSCLLQPWHYPWLSRCLPGAVRDLWQPHATRSPVTWEPGSCPPEP